MMTSLEKRLHLQRVKQSINGNIVKAIEAVYRIKSANGEYVNYVVAEPHRQMLTTGLLGDKSALFRIINKGRQGGFSIFQAVECSAIASTMPNTNQYYVATKEDQAKSWLKKVEQIAENSRLNFDGSRIIDIDTVSSSLMEKVFRHMPKGAMKDIQNSYIGGFAASPAGIRGETAVKVILDEFPNMIQRENQQKNVYAAIGFFIAQGGACDIQGTPLVKSDFFWELYAGAGKINSYTPYYFPIIENWDEIDLNKPLIIKLDDLCEDERRKIMNLGIYTIIHNKFVNQIMVKDLAIQRMKIPYPWYDLGFLEQKRSEDLAIFKQELLGIPEDIMHRFIGPEMWQAIVTEQENKICHKQYEYRMGLDVAQKRDLTAGTIGHMDENGIIREDFIFELQGKYPQQARDIQSFCGYFPNLTNIYIDNTGSGIGLGDDIEELRGMPELNRVEFGGSIEIDPQIKKKMKVPELLALEFRKYITGKRYRAIDNQVARAHVLRVQKVQTDGNQSIRYTGKKGNQRDDHFWSKSLLCFGFNEKYNSITSQGTIGIMPTLKSLPNATVIIDKTEDNTGMLMW